jgi:hypothetical protein
LPALVVDLVSRRVVVIVTPGNTPAAPNMAVLRGVASLISLCQFGSWKSGVERV